MHINALPISMLTFQQPDGSILGYFGNAFFHHRGHGQRGNLRVPRKVLRKLLLDKLERSKVHWGHKLVHYEQTTVVGASQGDVSYTLQFNKEESSSNDQSLVSVLADLVVAADGIRSSVVQKLYQKGRLGGTIDNSATQNPSMDPLSASIGLRHTHVRLILGITNLSHPLLDERGFYMLDGKHRLFTMPYEYSRFDGTNRTMWQLSFATTDEKDRETPLNAESLLADVLQRCQPWHDPIIPMIQATPLETIWGT